jgi:NAD(P)-dependent dehydrogenase (short-subunit alcohol dehydrogenase family)
VTRTVVVTGAAGGIGTALVNRFAAAGDRVVALGRNADSLARLAQAEPVVCDVTDERSVSAAFAGIEAVDLLVNNAGIGESAPLGKTTLEAWTQHLMVNATGPFLCMRAVVPGMRERDSGVIVTVASGPR